MYSAFRAAMPIDNLQEFWRLLCHLNNKWKITTKSIWGNFGPPINSLDVYPFDHCARAGSLSIIFFGHSEMRKTLYPRAASQRYKQWPNWYGTKIASILHYHYFSLSIPMTSFVCKCMDVYDGNDPLKRTIPGSNLHDRRKWRSFVLTSFLIFDVIGSTFLSNEVLVHDLFHTLLFPWLSLAIIRLRQRSENCWNRHLYSNSFIKKISMDGMKLWLTVRVCMMERCLTKTIILLWTWWVIKSKYSQILTLISLKK